ncbi:uncharacterized protein LACBIDRAFT_334709 [Laccaria bicolor S238N-H82]|uniref:Predicted protein n=1 Tax=Laccaria bicolor (strain S238N-H82 / ATCC MYA-4686) TaxID=486041 RepID=B0E010_LACBS|nr:uncharacterized protein LACBIDRAFT_334709 [Laccaria bicolor S238N-H82]EDQ99816.1 predicted protein [Laccaria bicolor S238N-H82]|eukprot:XP_001889508.1 predicted protein [Laccaria bicolor S238N-H82]
MKVSGVSSKFLASIQDQSLSSVKIILVAVKLRRVLFKAGVHLKTKICRLIDQFTKVMDIEWLYRLRSTKVVGLGRHPNIPHMIAVSAFESEMSFLVFDDEYEGTVDRMLSQALKKDLKQSLILGLRTSGLDYLQGLKYPFVPVGSDHFVVMSCKGKVVISFDVEGVCQIEQSSEETSLSASADRALILFHELCEKTFDEACKAHYGGQQIQRAHIDEFDEDLPGNRFEKLDDNLSSSNAHASPSMTRGRALLAASPRQPDGRRQELIWKSATGVRVTLDDISLQFQDFLYSHPPSSEPILNRRRGRYMARTSHRCPGYNRIEITLTPDISRSAIVSHSSPTPGEICPVFSTPRNTNLYAVAVRYPINYGDNQEIDSNDRLREDIATKAMEGRMREEVPEAVSCGPAASSESLQPNVVTEPPVSKAGGGSTIPSVPTELTLTGQHDAEGSLKPVVRDVVVVDSTLGCWNTLAHVPFVGKVPTMVETTPVPSTPPRRPVIGADGKMVMVDADDHLQLSSGTAGSSGTERSSGTVGSSGTDGSSGTEGSSCTEGSSGTEESSVTAGSRKGRGKTKVKKRG